MDKTDLLIYCDWLTDNNIDPYMLRTIISHIDYGIIGINRLGTDIGNNNDYGDGGGGYGYDGGDGYGGGYSSSDSDGDGYGDCGTYGHGYGYGGNILGDGDCFYNDGGTGRDLGEPI